MICLVKRYLSDEGACQQPVLILPHAWLERLTTPLPVSLRPIKNPKPAKAQAWLDLAKVLLHQDMDQSAARSIAYLIDLAQGLPGQAGADLPDLPWHRAAADARDALQLQGVLPHATRPLLPVMAFKAALRHA